MKLEKTSFCGWGSVRCHLTSGTHVSTVAPLMSGHPGLCSGTACIDLERRGNGLRAQAGSPSGGRYETLGSLQTRWSGFGHAEHSEHSEYDCERENVALDSATGLSGGTETCTV